MISLRPPTHKYSLLLQQQYPVPTMSRGSMVNDKDLLYSLMFYKQRKMEHLICIHSNQSFLPARRHKMLCFLFAWEQRPRGRITETSSTKLHAVVLCEYLCSMFRLIRSGEPGKTREGPARLNWTPCSHCEVLCSMFCVMRSGEPRRTRDQLNSTELHSVILSKVLRFYFLFDQKAANCSPGVLLFNAWFHLCMETLLPKGDFSYNIGSLFSVVCFFKV